MSSTTDDDGSSSEDLSNLLALAAENLAPEKRAGGGPREAPVVRDFADDRARVAALAAIADRAAALPPYAGDDAETDAVFDELLELHASIAASDVSAAAAASADAGEARKDRDALERAAGLADAVAALAGDRDKEDGVAAHADAVRHRLEWTLEDLRAKQNASVALAAEVVRARRDALRHALDVAEDNAGDAEAMDAVETAFEDAALDAEAGRTRVLSLANLEEARDVTRQKSGEGDGEALEARIRNRETSKSDDDSVGRASDELSSSSGSSLDDVVDRELRNQRFLRTQARARANSKVVEAAAEARRAVEAESRAAAAGESGESGERSDSAKENAIDSEDERKTSASEKRKKKAPAPLRRRLVRDALVALPVLVFSLYDTARGERRRAAGAERAARRRAAADSAATSPRSPARFRVFAHTRGGGGARNAEGADSPYAVPSSMTMKVGANSYEVENGRVVTLATPAEAREVRKAFGMG